MFKNRAIQMKLVKTDDNTDMVEIPDMPKLELPSKEDVKDVSREIIKNSALAVIAIIGAAAVARTASEVAIDHWTN